MKPRTTAWMPFHPTEPWEFAADACAGWLREQQRQYGDRPGVVTPVLQTYQIASVDRLGWCTSPRASSERVPSGTLGVLAYVPAPEQLEFATRLARDGPLAVVETASHPLIGWARWCEALNLRTGEGEDALPAEVVDGIEQLQFYGNNGFTRGFDRDQALRILREDLGDADRHLIWGGLLAAGQGASGVERLKKADAR